MRESNPDTLIWHRAALAGAKPAITSEPQCGWFKRRLVRFGPWVGCRIWLDQKTDDTGELTEDAVLCCDIDGRPSDPEDQWTYLAGQPITEKEFKFLMSLSSYAKARDPREPLANPRKPIDLLTVPAPTFQAKKETQMSITDTPAPISADLTGHNLPLKDRLQEKHQLLVDRVKELLAACGRAPERIDDDATQGKIGDLYKLLQAAHKKGEASRADEKEPFLMGGREVDNFFKETVVTPLERWMAALKRRSDIYINAKVEAERQRRAEEARKAQDEADRKLEAARKAEEAARPKVAERKLGEAVEAQAVATQAAALAQAKPAEMAQTRGEHSMATVQMRWTHEVSAWDELDYNALREFISRDDIDKAIRAFVRLHKGTRQLSGVRIFEAPNTQFR